MAYPLRVSGSRGERTSSEAREKSAKPVARDAEPARTSTGTPETVAVCEASYTGRYLKKVLK